MTASRSPRRRNGRRGRPPKYGRPSQVVAVTLPIETIRTLRRRHSDLGWAIVELVQAASARYSEPPIPAAADLVQVGGGQSLIVVPPDLVRSIPKVKVVPLSPERAFLALEPGRGLADLEVAVIDRIELAAEAPERQGLQAFLAQLRAWRRDRKLSFDLRTIILVAARGK